MQNLEEFEKKLGYKFKDEKNLLKALTHRSCKKPYNNEKLEFLGDAVLDLVVGEFLYFKFPKADEGTLSKLRASLVDEEGFAKLANEIDLGKYILISEGEEKNGGRTKPSLLSNAFEALMGAIYLESGLDEVKKITLELLNRVYPKIDLESIFKDYKTKLQELTQAEFGSLPEYKLINSYGPDHKKVFEIALYLNNKELTKAKGKSKKAAQQAAAKEALEKLKREEK